MKAATLCGVLTALTLAIPEAKADPKRARSVDTPASAKKPLTLPLPGVGWGQTPKEVGAQIDNVLDLDYLPLYQTAESLIKLKELNAGLAEDKAQFRRGRIDVGTESTKLDGTPLRGEYTHNNNETVMSLSRQGETTYFFFIHERLWKIIEEKALTDSGPLGKTYNEAVVKMSTDIGVAGRVRPTGTTSGGVEVDWMDADTHLRVIQRSDVALALAYEDNGTLAKLSSLRTSKPAATSGD